MATRPQINQRLGGTRVVSAHLSRRLGNALRSLAGTVMPVALVFLHPLFTRLAYAESGTVADRAQQLFDEGRALMKAMKYAQACEKLDESESLDPGGGTILNLGICRRYEGRTATAYAVLTKALARANADHRADRVATAERHLKELAGMLSRLLVRLPMGADASAMTVEIDGTTIPHDQLGQARQLDPGVHNVRATLAGHVPWSVRVTLAPVADEQLVEIPVLEPEPNEKPLTKTHSIIAFKSPLPSQLRASRSRRRRDPTLQWLGYALTGVGATALGVGTYYGIRTLVLRARSDKHFDGRYCTNQSCVEDWNAAKTSSAVASVAVGAGLLTAGTGGYVLLRSSTGEVRQSLQVSLQVGNSAAIAVGTVGF